MTRGTWGVLWLGLMAWTAGCDDGGGGSGGAGGGTAADMGGAGGEGGGALQCAASERACAGECIDPASDARHCGGCGNACMTGQRCLEGNCRAPTGEACNGRDDDLDGATDEGDDGNPLQVQCDNLCGAGTRTCTNGQLGECSAPAPQAEACDGADNDCDGKTDEGVTTTYYRDADGDTHGDPALANALQACTPPMGTDYVASNDDCDDGDGDTYPGAAESCADEKDNDCDMVVNNDCPCAPIGDTRPCGADEGACRAGVQTCGEMGWSECGGEDFIGPAEESCTGSDDDCDGNIDENLPEDPWEGLGGNDANNDTCERARPVPAVEEDAEAAVIINDGTLYHAAADAPADSDWYRVNANEGFGFCVPGTRECGMTLAVVFRLPEFALRDDYELCLHYDDGLGCGDVLSTWCMGVDSDEFWSDENGAYSFAVIWDGRCALDSSREFFIEVRGPQNINACSPYTIGMAFSQLEDVECGDDRADPVLVNPNAMGM